MYISILKQKIADEIVNRKLYKWLHNTCCFSHFNDELRRDFAWNRDVEYIIFNTHYQSKYENSNRNQRCKPPGSGQ